MSPAVSVDREMVHEVAGEVDAALEERLVGTGDRVELAACGRAVYGRDHGRDERGPQRRGLLSSMPRGSKETTSKYCRSSGGGPASPTSVPLIPGPGPPGMIRSEPCLCGGVGAGQTADPQGEGRAGRGERSPRAPG